MKFGFKFDLNDDIRYNEFSSAMTKKNYVKNMGYYNNKNK